MYFSIKLDLLNFWIYMALAGLMPNIMPELTEPSLTISDFSSIHKNSNSSNVSSTTSLAIIITTTTQAVSINQTSSNNTNYNVINNTSYSDANTHAITIATTINSTTIYNLNANSISVGINSETSTTNANHNNALDTTSIYNSITYAVTIATTTTSNISTSSNNLKENRSSLFFSDTGKNSFGLDNQTTYNEIDSTSYSHFNTQAVTPVTDSPAAPSTPDIISTPPSSTHSLALLSNATSTAISNTKKITDSENSLYSKINIPLTSTMYEIFKSDLTTTDDGQIHICPCNVQQNHQYEATDTNYHASLAVDNDPNTCSFTAQANVTLRDELAWWQADLGSAYEVRYIKIQDYISQFNGYIEIYFSYSNDVNIQNQKNLCLTINNDLINPNKINTYYCKQPRIGRYLTIRKSEGSPRHDALALCELQVYGKQLAVVNLEKTIESLKLENKKLENDRIIIGVVVGILSALLAILIGLLIGYLVFNNRSKDSKFDSESYIDQYDSSMEYPEFMTMDNHAAGESKL